MIAVTDSARDAHDPERGEGPISGPGSEGTTEIKRLRNRIETLDRELMELIGQRLRLARSIGAEKRLARLPVQDLAREAAVVRHAGALAREVGVDAEIARSIFWQLIDLSRHAQCAAPPEAGECAS